MRKRFSSIRYFHLIHCIAGASGDHKFIVEQRLLLHQGNNASWQTNHQSCNDTDGMRIRILAIAGMHPDRCGLAGQAGRDGKPVRRLLPVRLWQLHRGDRHPGRSDTHFDVLHSWGQAGCASAGTPRRGNQTQRSKAFPDGQVGFPVLHGQGDD